MPPRATLLSFAPYRFLPPYSGGHLGIGWMHEYLGRLVPDHVISTIDNQPSGGESFTLHPLMQPGPQRYIPGAGASKAAALGRQVGATAVWCEHPYLAPTAARVAKKLGVRWYLRSHNIESQRFRELGKRWWPLMARFEGWAMRRAASTFFVTAEDADWAVRHYRLPRQRAHLAPFGTVLETAPVADSGAKARVAESLNLDASKPWLYFLGAMDYAPNITAVETILDEVAPRIDNDALILLAGKGMPHALQARVAGTGGCVRYLGFLPDLDDFLRAQDAMINPVTTGGGIKTKAVEALAWGKPVVSTTSGATGLMREACGSALFVLPDADWASFVAAARQAAHTKPQVPAAFYREYSWSAIAQGIVDIVASEAR